MINILDLYKEEGSLNMGPLKSGLIYEGRFYEFGSMEYKNLFLIEGSNPDAKGTLLGIMHESVKSDPDSIINKQ